MNSADIKACEKIARTMTGPGQEVRVTQYQIQVRTDDGRVLASAAKRVPGVCLLDMKALASNYARAWRNRPSQIMAPIPLEIA